MGIGRPNTFLKRVYSMMNTPVVPPVYGVLAADFMFDVPVMVSVSHRIVVVRPEPT